MNDLSNAFAVLDLDVDDATAQTTIDPKDGEPTVKRAVSKCLIDSLPGQCDDNKSAVSIPAAMCDSDLLEWKHSLIGRLNFQHITLAEATEQLKNQWQIIGTVDFIPIRNGYFAIKLDNDVDKSMVRSTGPWVVKYKNSHKVEQKMLLRLRDWTPSFNPDSQAQSNAQVWIKFPYLPMEFWTKDMIFAIGRGLGTPIKVSRNTLEPKHGYFASVLVDVDFAKTVPDEILITVDGEDGFLQPVEIPKFPKFCFHCKVVGHRLGDCRAIKAEIKSTVGDGEVQEKRKQQPNAVIEKEAADMGENDQEMDLESDENVQQQEDSLLDDKGKKYSGNSSEMIAAQPDQLDQQSLSTSSEYKMPLVWIDLEMTGLNIEIDRILEIACIITDGNLTHLVEGPDLVIHQTKECLDNMGEWCVNHHAASGLTEKVLHSTVNEGEAEKQVIDFVKKHIGTYTPLLAGNSVYVDFQFLKKYMPDLASLFSHVVVDVSSVKALCIRWYPKDNRRAPSKENKHRAMDDIKESIKELKYFKENIFKSSKHRK